MYNIRLQAPTLDRKCDISHWFFCSVDGRVDVWIDVTNLAQFFQVNLVPRAFPLKNGWGGKRPWHRLVTCPLVHPKILGVIN